MSLDPDVGSCTRMAWEAAVNSITPSDTFAGTDTAWDPDDAEMGSRCCVSVRYTRSRDTTMVSFATKYDATSGMLTCTASVGEVGEIENVHTMGVVVK